MLDCAALAFAGSALAFAGATLAGPGPDRAFTGADFAVVPFPFGFFGALFFVLTAIPLNSDAV